MIAWQRDLEGATSPAEVVQLVRSFIAGMPREAFASLPAGCRPSFIAGAEDVRAWNERLSETYWRLRRAGSESQATQELWSFLLRATTRLARLEQERAVSQPGA